MPLSLSQTRWKFRWNSGWGEDFSVSQISPVFWLLYISCDAYSVLSIWISKNIPCSEAFSNKTRRWISNLCSFDKVSVTNRTNFETKWGRLHKLCLNIVEHENQRSSFPFQFSLDDCFAVRSNATFLLFVFLSFTESSLSNISSSLFRILSSQWIIIWRCLYSRSSHIFLNAFLSCQFLIFTCGFWCLSHYSIIGSIFWLKSLALAIVASIWTGGTRPILRNIGENGTCRYIIFSSATSTSPCFEQVTWKYIPNAFILVR